MLMVRKWSVGGQNYEGDYYLFFFYLNMVSFLLLKVKTRNSY